MNPYQLAMTDRTSARRGRSLVLPAAIGVLWCVAIVVSARFFGPHGFGVALYAVACSWFIITRVELTALWPLNASKPSAAECVVVLAICGVLHGLALPAVGTNCVGRRRPIPAVPATVSEPQDKSLELR